MAEEVGFEPTVPFDITSFQDWLLKPLGHSSKRYIDIITFFLLVVKKILKIYKYNKNRLTYF